MESALAGLLRLRPCRVTNEGQEMMVPQFASTNEIDLGPQYQVPDPEKGPLEKRVGRTFIDALFSDEISLEDMQYWFTTPPGMQEVELLCKAARNTHHFQHHGQSCVDCMDHPASWLTCFVL